MIFEQGFFALPEFLVGTGFTRYEAEGTLVMAFAMAVLQELNGRNVNCPVAAISGEKVYPSAPSRSADLFLDYSRVGVFNTALQAFGQHENSWLEAKFFRKNLAGMPTLDPTAATYALLRDLVRLACFPPHTVGNAVENGRYLLHVYEGAYIDHLSLQRNVGAGGGRVSRGWLQGLHQPGSSHIDFGDLSAEPLEFDRQVGCDLRTLKATAKVTTLSVGGPGSAYNLYLTKIEEFSVEFGSRRIEGTRTTSVEDRAGSWAALASDVDSKLSK
jgi:hypothetical protein